MRRTHQERPALGHRAWDDALVSDASRGRVEAGRGCVVEGPGELREEIY